MQALCKQLPEELARTFKRKVKVQRCALDRHDGVTYVAYEYSGSFDGVTTYHYLVPYSPGLMLAIVGGGRTDAGIEHVRQAQVDITRQAIRYIEKADYFARMRRALDASRREDYRQAVALLKPIAEVGDHEAQYNLGVHYANGLGIKQDHAEALRLYRLAAAQENSLALTNLAAMYFHGKGVPRDLARAAELYKQAAEAGEPIAQTSYAGMLYKGLGAAKNAQMAVRWWLKAAKQGHEPAAQNLILVYEAEVKAGNTPALYNLALLYLEGVGVPKDSSKGIRLLEEAAQSGFKPAAAALSKIYGEGLFGVAPDPQKAKRWAL